MLQRLVRGSFFYVLLALFLVTRVEAVLDLASDEAHHEEATHAIADHEGDSGPQPLTDHDDSDHCEHCCHAHVVYLLCLPELTSAAGDSLLDVPADTLFVFRPQAPPTPPPIR